MDPFSIVAGLASAGASIFSGLSAKKGQEKANAQQMDFNMQEAQKQRDFEEKMFGSRYQMTRRDLEAARYNPLLAFGPGPGTPSGVAAHAEPKSTTGEMAQIFSRTAREMADISLIKAQTARARSEATMAALDAEAYSSMPWLSRVKAVLSSLPGLGGLMGGVGIGSLLRGINSGGAVSRFRDFSPRRRG